MIKDNSNNEKQEDSFPTDALVPITVFDHIKIIDEETGEQILNKRG